MSSIIVTAKIVCVSKDARKKVLQAFHKIIEYTQPYEPEVLRYIVTFPIEDTAGTVMYMIEEYATNAANEAHIATQPVQDLITLFTSGSVLSQPPEVHICSVVANKKPTSGSPTISLASNPVILLTHTELMPGKAAQALKSWSCIVEHVGKDEFRTLGYTVGEDREGNCVRTVEVYESVGALENVHDKDEALVKMKRDIGVNGTGVEGKVRVKAVDGFLGRDSGCKL